MYVPSITSIIGKGLMKIECVVAFTHVDNAERGYLKIGIGYISIALMFKIFDIIISSSVLKWIRETYTKIIFNKFSHEY